MGEILMMEDEKREFIEAIANALYIHPDEARAAIPVIESLIEKAKRAAWCAGRDAAAMSTDWFYNVRTYDLHAIVKHISLLQPPENL
jgi:hypothetical protein